MAIIGSARLDENYGITGGKPGDQRQGSSAPDYSGELSLQNFYEHKYGWFVWDWENPEDAKRAADQMRKACDNPNIGYAQDTRYQLIDYLKETGIRDLAKVEKRVNCDCTSLMRVIIWLVTGKDPGDFYTGNMPAVMDKLVEQGILKEKKNYTNAVVLFTGAVLCSRQKGHTALVVNGADPTPVKPAPVAPADKPIKLDAAMAYDEAVAGRYQVTAESLHMRAGAGSSKQHICYLKKDQKIVCYGFYTKKDGTKWLLVESKKHTGFVSGKYVKRIGGINSK